MPPYNHELALQLKERYLLAGSTVRNWKYLGRIPERYIKGYVTRQRAPQSTVDTLMLWLKLPFIKETGFKDVRKSVLRDLQRPDDGRKHARLRLEEAKSIIQQLEEFQHLFEEALKENPIPLQMQQLFQQSFINLRCFINDPHLYDHLQFRKRKPKELDIVPLQKQLSYWQPTIPPLPKIPPIVGEM